MKFRIRHYQAAWHRKWTLQYHWNDEGGGGWSSIYSAPFRWMLRAIAPFCKWWYDIEIKRLAYKEEFEL